MKEYNITFKELFPIVLAVEMGNLIHKQVCIVPFGQSSSSTYYLKENV